MRQKLLLLLILLAPLMAYCQKRLTLNDVLEGINKHYYSPGKQVNYTYTINYKSVTEGSFTSKANCSVCEGFYNMNFGELISINSINGLIQIDKTESIVAISNNNVAKESNPMFAIQSLRDIEPLHYYYRISDVKTGLKLLKLYTNVHMAGQADSTFIYFNYPAYSISKMISYINPEYDMDEGKFGKNAIMEITFSNETIVNNQGCKGTLFNGSSVVTLDRMNVFHLQPVYKNYELIDLRQ